MKCQYLIGASLSILALAITSCTRQETAVDNALEESQERVLVPMYFGAESETSEEKATISGTSVNWEAEDNVAVIDDKYNGINRFFLTGGAGTTSATLGGTVTAGSASYCAVFPADAAGIREGTKVSVTVPEKQVVSSGKSMDGNALVNVAYSTGSSLSFKNVCGFIQVTLSRADIKIIEVEGTNLAGTVLVNASTGVLDSVTSGENLVTLSYAGGAAFPTGTYYIAVLPGTSSKFTLRMLTDTAFGRKIAEGEVLIARKTYYSTSNSDVTIGTDNLILTADALVAWNSGRTGSETDIVALGADIDMSGKSWTAKNFAGTFEGRGCSIRNFSGNATFIQDNSGTIKDLTIDGTLTPATTTIPYFGVFAAKNTGTGAITGCTNQASVIRTFEANATFSYAVAYAGIVGYNEGTLTNCTNCGEVSVSQACDTETLVNNNPLPSAVLGGIAAYSSTDISGCINSGIIARSVNGHTNGSLRTDFPVTREVNPDPCLGGIVGLVNDATVSSCRNSGAIRCLDRYLPRMNEDSWTSIGGIVGAIEGTVTGCVNSGPIQIEGLNDGAPYNTYNYMPYAGGIVGSGIYAKVNSSNYIDNLVVSNCSNSSDIQVNDCGTRSNGAVGGIVGWPCNDNKLENTSISSCTNTGNIYEYGCGRIRIGGIMGSSGPARDCHFTGDILSYHKNGLIASENGSEVAIGGICGINQFKTGNDIADCTVGNDADGTTIRYNLTEEDGTTPTIPANACFVGIGGLVGRAYTPTVENHTVFAGCSVKCAIFSNHPKDIGLLVGQFAGGGNNNSLRFGSPSNRITIRNGSLVSFSRPLTSGAPYTTTTVEASATNVNTPVGDDYSTWAWSGGYSGSIVYGGDPVKMGFLTGSTSSSVSNADFNNITFSNN